MITVQLQDSNGNPVIALSGGVTVNLASSYPTTGTFYSNSGGTAKITSITIPAGQSSASFYFSDTAAESPILTASSGSLTPATTTFTINQYKLVFTTGASQTVAAGQLSTEIIVQRETNTGAVTTHGNTVTVQLSYNFFHWPIRKLRRQPKSPVSQSALAITTPPTLSTTSIHQLGHQHSQPPILGSLGNNTVHYLHACSQSLCV